MEARAKNGANDPPGGNCDSVQARALGVGGGNIDSKYRIGDNVGDHIAVDRKAMRATCGYFNSTVSESDIELLAMFRTFEMLNGREGTGANNYDFIAWTGRLASWKRRMQGRVYGALERGVLEKVRAHNGGETLLISQKGERVLQVWEGIRLEVIDRMEKRRAVALLNKEAKRLKAERLKELRREAKR
jgi:hypothetical protein